MYSSTKPSAAATCLVAGVVLPEDLDAIRRVLRGLVLPGQRRLHMKDESAPRKRYIATAISVSEVQATIYDAGRRYRNERERRAACLRAIVEDAAQRGDAMLVLTRRLARQLGQPAPDRVHSRGRLPRHPPLRTPQSRL